MAYNSSNEERVELAKLQKNSRGDYIIASKITNKNTGTVNIDIRNFYTNNNNNGEVLPTSKGVRFNAENLLDFLTGLVQALEADEKLDLADILNECDDEDVEDNEEDAECDDEDNEEE